MLKVKSCAVAQLTAGLGQEFLLLSLQYIVRKYLMSVFMWCQQNPRNRIWSVYHR